MIDFSKISKKSLIGKFLRKILKLIPSNSVLPILQGRLRGMKWIIGSGVFSCWLGCYESEKQKAFIKQIKLQDIVYDIGAHVGFYTLLASKLVGDRGKVYAFEPLPRNIFYLKKHISLNKLKNVEIIEAAVSDKEGEENFLEGDSYTSKLDSRGSFTVKTISLDNLIKNKKILPPNVIKIDVEGAELKVLLGAKDIIEKYKPVIFIALDNPNTKEKVIQMIKNFGYNVLDLNFEDIQEINNISEIICINNEKY
jgi:FkbM family methyltransferase